MLSEPPDADLGDGVDAFAGIPGANAGRRDGRTSTEMRQYTVTLGALSEADGSARYQSAGTDILVGVYGPMDCPIQKQNSSKLHVQVSFRRRGVAAAAGDKVVEAGAGAEVSAARDLRLLVSDIVEGSANPRKAIVVAVQVLSDNGSVTAAAHNATILALTDAGVLLRCLPTTVCVAIHNNALMIDPVKVEEAEAEAVITAVFDTALAKNGFMSVYTNGDCGGERLFAAAIENCRQLAVKTRSTIKDILDQYATRNLVWRDLA